MHATATAPSMETANTASSRPVTAPARNMAVDAYRGLVMLLMMGEVMRFAEVYKAFPGSLFWRILAFNQTHVEWAGMGLHDTIQPGFTFLVGAALPYSIAARTAKGKSFGEQLAHTIWRSVVLIFLEYSCVRLARRRLTTPLKTRLRRLGSASRLRFCWRTQNRAGNGPRSA